MMEKLRTIGARFPNRVKTAMKVECEIELTEMKRRTPVDEGSLRASEHLEGPEGEAGGTFEVRWSAGGPAAPYAIHVHENLDAHHPVGQAKFMESVLLESLPHMGKRIGKRIGLEDID
jgi:hypothetical protein